MDRVFIIHSWTTNPGFGWYPWLKKELTKKGFKVQVLKMPDTNRPRIGKWVSHVAKNVKKLDENTYFVGHSIGCQTIMRYLAKQKTKAGGAVLVAGWFTLKGLETKEDWKIANPWLNTPMNLAKVKRTKITAILSDNDQFVPLENKKLLKQKLGAKIIMKHKSGHFDEEDGFKKLPIALKELIAITR
jgi:uncharacterized protein